MGENEGDKYFDLSKVSGICEYVKFWLREYSNDPRQEAIVLEKLKVIFSDDSEYRIKILDGNNFCSTFRERLRTKWLRNLEPLLLKIDESRYSTVNFKFNR